MRTATIDEVRQALADAVDRVEAPAPDEVAIRRRSAHWRRRRYAGAAGAVAAAAAVVVGIAVVGFPGHAHRAAPAGPGDGAPPAHDLGTMPILDDGVVGLLDLDTGAVHRTKLRLRPHETAHERSADGELVGAVPGGFLATDAESRLVWAQVSGDHVSVARASVSNTLHHSRAVTSVALSADGDLVAFVGTDDRLRVRSLTGSRTGFDPGAFGALHSPDVYAVGPGHVVYADRGVVWLQSASGRVRLGAGDAIESVQLAGSTMAVLTGLHTGGADHAELYDLARPRTPIAELAAGTLSPDGSAFAQVAPWRDEADGPHQDDVVRVWHRGETTTITGVPNVSGVVWLNGSTVLVASNADPAEIYDPASTAGWDLAAIQACDVGTGGCRTVWHRDRSRGAGTDGAGARVVAPLQWLAGR